MNREMPTMPSLPTTAISADAPLSITYSSETIAVVGKYTCVNVPPDSYRTSPSGMSTDSSCGSQGRRSASGSAASNRFLCSSDIKGIHIPQRDRADESTTVLTGSEGRRNFAANGSVLGVTSRIGSERTLAAAHNDELS